MSESRARGAGLSVVLILTLLAWAPPAAAQEREFETDSIAGDLVEVRENAFVVRVDDGRTMTLEIPADTAQERREETEDTTDTTGEIAHSSYMSREDIVHALEQIRASDETDRVRVHYITEGAPVRHVVVWIAVGEPRR